MAVDGDAGTIVVVEDDPNIADLVDLYLRREGYRPILAPDGAEGLAAIERERPRLVILDVGLPGDFDGLDLCRRIRASSSPLSSVPVIMLTARDGEIDRVLGLELGADDYVTKPFSPRELVARVKAILRRAEVGFAGVRGGTSSGERPQLLEVDRVRIDTRRREVTVSGTTIGLATREFDLLTYLAENTGIALTRQQLLDGVWGPGWYGDERTVDVHVRQLRKKLGAALPLTTVWGVGYRLA